MGSARTGGGQQQVGRLDVAMDKAGGVDLGQCREQLVEQDREVPRGQGAGVLGEQPLDRAAAHQRQRSGTTGGGQAKWGWSRGSRPPRSRGRAADPAATKQRAAGHHARHTVPAPPEPIGSISVSPEPSSLSMPGR